MALSEEQIQVVVDAVASWRVSEYIYISSYALYIYYVLTTIHEEARVIFPQKWNIGRVLFTLTRYCTCISIAIQLLRDYRNYYLITPMACKILLILWEVVADIASVSSDAIVGLCLCALLQARYLLYATIMLLCTGPRLVGVIFAIVSDIQAQARNVSTLDAELGYPCYSPGYKATIYNVGRVVRTYVSLGAFALLFAMGIGAALLRYRKQRGKLINVLIRDGGLYYLTVLALRFAAALFYTPSLIENEAIEASAIFWVFTASQHVAIPILAQRLMIDIRNVDYMGSQPVASTLLFASSPHDSSSHEGKEITSFEMSNTPSCTHQSTMAEQHGEGVHDPGDVEKAADGGDIQVVIREKGTSV